MFLVFSLLYKDTAAEQKNQLLTDINLCQMLYTPYCARRQYWSNVQIMAWTIELNRTMVHEKMRLDWPTIALDGNRKGNLEKKSFIK